MPVHGDHRYTRVAPPLGLVISEGDLLHLPHQPLGQVRNPLVPQRVGIAWLWLWLWLWLHSGGRRIFYNIKEGI